MKRDPQKLAMTGSLSTYTAAGTQRNGRLGGVDSPRIFLIVLAALAIVMGTMVPAAFADTAADTTTGTDTAAETADTTSIFASGTGTAEDPYVIDDATQLAAFAASVNAGNDYKGEYVKLGADITLPATDWTPIGTGTRSGDTTATGATPFAGSFNGGTHTVSGLTITASSPLAATPDSALGLFGVLDGAHVQALTLTDVNIDVPTSDLAGAVAGLALNDASVSNVQVSGKVSGQSNIGGVIGYMAGSGAVVTSTNEATVSGTGSNIGGIVGNTAATADDQIRLSFNINDGDVSGDSAVGGIVGHNDAHLAFNTNNGTVTVAASPTGSAVGDEGEHSFVENDAEATDPESETTGEDGPVTAPAMGSPLDDAATQQAGTADPNAAADNTAQTGASLQQTGDDTLRVVGVFVVIALTAGATMLILRRRSL